MRVILADDSVLLREGLARILKETGFDVVGQAAEGEELIRLVDLDPPRCASDTSKHPSVGVLVLSQHLQTMYALKLLGDASSGLGYNIRSCVWVSSGEASGEASLDSHARSRSRGVGWMSSCWKQTTPRRAMT